MCVCVCMCVCLHARVSILISTDVSGCISLLKHKLAAFDRSFDTPPSTSRFVKNRANWRGWRVRIFPSTQLFSTFLELRSAALSKLLRILSFFSIILCLCGPFQGLKCFLFRTGASWGLSWDPTFSCNVRTQNSSQLSLCGVTDMIITSISFNSRASYTSISR